MTAAPHLTGSIAKPDGRKSPQNRERARARWRDPEKRRQHGELTRQRMNDPDVRQRIRDGMQAAAESASELRALRSAWAAARPSVREKFLAEVLAPLWGTDG
jgi:hypothetical protein